MPTTPNGDRGWSKCNLVIQNSNAQLMSEVKSFQEINISLRKGVAELREIVKSENTAITELKTHLKDEYEQYSRRNTL